MTGLSIIVAVAALSVHAAAAPAFASTVAGWAELVTCSVFASTDGDLPDDDHQSGIALA